jgi:CRISPR-associated endonuclease/helicase Cas3
MQAAVRLAAEFHDLGKLDDQNQRVLASGRGHLPLNHVDAGVAQIYCGMINAVRQMAAILIYAHHLGLPALVEESARGPGNAFRDPGPTPAGTPLKARSDDLLAQYSRLHSSVIDGLPQLDGPIAKTRVGPLPFRIALSCLVDADHSDTARHYQDPVAADAPVLEPNKRLNLLNRYVDQLSRNKDDDRTILRSSIYRHCRDAELSAGMLACDSPVGSGKTTAIMAHLLKAAEAKELRRVIVVLPFTNIIDQSVDVYRKALVSPDEDACAIVAAHHHKAEFDDPSSRQFAYLWHAPVVVTTAVQFFETLAARNPAALRKLHQVPGSAIFIDESHTALPAQLWPQAWKWLEELEQKWGCHLVFGSGSLNRFWELKEFVDPPAKLPDLVHESVHETSAGVERHRIRYRSHTVPLDLDRLAAFLTDRPAPRLLIVNTVQSAAAIARHLAQRLGGEHVEHLSTALTPRDRKATLDLVRLRLRQPNHRDWTLVATSCVEAGVDISFRTALRERCSLTSLLQTAGRVNRSGEFGTASVWDIQLKHDHLLRPHPAFDVPAQVLATLFSEDKISPDFCTEALRREIRQEGMKKVNEDILKAERNADFPTVEKLFRVIASDTVTAVAEEALVKALERGQKVTSDELQAGSVQIWQSRAHEWNLDDVAYFPGLKKWTLTYDSFLGYMAGVLPLVDADALSCSIV